MKVYLAAPYRRREELRRYRLELMRGSWNQRVTTEAEAAVTVTSRWLDRDPAMKATEAELAMDTVAGRRFADEDVEDVRSADLLVLFTEANRDRHRGGMHVEFGIALTLGKALAIVGPRMNVFHTLEGVRAFTGEYRDPVTRELIGTPAERQEEAWEACRDWILGGGKYRIAREVTTWL